MGKATDAAVAIIVLIIGLWVLTRLGLTLPAIEKMLHSFFFPPSSTPTNATSSLILVSLAASNSRIRQKASKARELFVRMRKLRGIFRIDRRSGNGEEYGRR